ncbi:MAG: hypothetical protein J6Y62_07060 [Clostridia bacterium]|nr:hypothetical protein [Clostridia bacterium]
MNFVVKYLLWTSPIVVFQTAGITVFALCLQEEKRTSMDDDAMGSGWFLSWFAGLVHFIVVGCSAGSEAAKDAFMLYPIGGFWGALLSSATWIVIGNVTLIAAALTPALWALAKGGGMDKKSLAECDRLLRMVCLPSEIGGVSPFERRRKELESIEGGHCPDGCCWWTVAAGFLTAVLAAVRFSFYMSEGFKGL